MVLVFGALCIRYGRMDAIGETGHCRNLCSDDAIPLSFRVGTGGADVSLGQAIQAGEKRPGDPLWRRDRSTGGHRRLGFFCGLPHRWKYFSHSSRHRYVPAHYSGFGCADPAGETDQAAYPGVGLCRGRLRAVLVLAYEYSGLVRASHRSPGMLGDRWASPEAFDQPSFGGDGARVADGRVLPAGPLALSPGVDPNVLKPQSDLCLAKLASECTGRMGVAGGDETRGQGLNRSAFYGALSLGYGVPGPLPIT